MTPSTAGEPRGERRRHIPGLTGVRALMGTWVLADHLAPGMFLLLPGTAVLHPVLSGGLAIDTFFIMSGFVVAHVHGERFRRLEARAYRTFLRARLARLYPVHLFTLLITAVLVALAAARGTTLNPGTHYSTWTFLGNLAGLQAFPGVDPWNWPSWSVSAELVAYLIFPLAGAALVRLRGRSAAVLALALALATTALVERMVTGEHATALAAVLVVRPVGDFALGCLLAVVWRRVVRPHRRWDAAAVAALAAVLGVLVLAPTPGSWRWLVVPLLGVFVLAVASSTGPVRRFLETPVMEWAGRTSYSRYLVHVPVLVLLFQWIPVAPHTVAEPLAVRIALVALWFVAPFVAGWLTFRFIEEPARRRLVRPRRPAAVEEAETPAGRPPLETAQAR